MKPVLVISDTHYHNFHQYAQVNAKGINTRLADIMRATVEAARALRAAGGDTIVHCGDTFHVRGNIPPTVLNPVMEMYRTLINQGFKVYMISGNHDLETNEAASVSSAITALQDVGVKVINQTEWFKISGDAWTFVPWTPNLEALRKTIMLPVETDEGDLIVRKNLVIHAPMNGVIEGLPDHGLTTKDFEGCEYDNVFVGHYHNHKMFQANGGDTCVYSVGALTHQNWGDVDARAGYILYHPEKMGRVEQYETSAPKFHKVEFDNLDAFTDAADNYVKVVGGDFTDPTEIETVRNALILQGAKAVVVDGLVRRPAVTRSGTTSTTTAPTVHTILGDYIDRNYPGDADVKLAALEILGEVYD